MLGLDLILEEVTPFCEIMNIPQKEFIHKKEQGLDICDNKLLSSP
jgi:hypothetical protein